MTLTLVLFFIFGTLASQAMSRTIHEASIANKHEQWMATYGRKYESKSEKEKRFNIFKDNLEYIESFNKAGNKSYKLGINEFADMTHDEFLAAHTGYKMPHNPTTSISTSFRYENFSEVPTSLDWREKGAVTAIKYQGTCGCCWAFSAVAAIEGIIQISTANLISLSEQQLLDCSTNGNHGCEGGWMMNAFEYVMQNKGITKEETYPYKAIQGTCDMEKVAAQVVDISGYEMVPANDEEALLKAVTNQPVSVALDGSGLDFQHYKTGVFNGDCGTSMTHAVTIIGYGTNEEGKNYWLIKNSWGESWGENGYMKIERDVNTPIGLCGIAKKASYPIA
ncbi:PREDICTED: zingipain-2-like [Theobroma cacao]|uniref:Zingipain-2-like n=1 Tax=Theobroma cacao TaxID=3641 RepID=A0AB32VZX4_THECC|nr:PREDICTED: zingipain-2-like [Theobroma cacao]